MPNSLGAISPKASEFRPTVWLGQSVDTSSICSSYAELRDVPFLTSLGCGIRRPSLFSSHFNENLKVRLGLFGPLMLDSGGFALSKKPNPNWTVATVGDLISKTSADIFVSLDFPPSTRDSSHDRRDKIARSMQNYKVLSNRFPQKVVMPVIHGRDISEIEFSVGLIAKYSINPPWLGLGGMVPLLQNRRVKGLSSTPEKFIASALAFVRSVFPTSKIHVFGAGGTRTFPAVCALEADSGDSIGWRQAAGFGSIFFPMKSQRVVKWNNEKRPPRRQLDDSDLSQLDNCGCPVCRNRSIKQKLGALRRHFHNRSIHNAWTLAHQCNSWPPTREGLASNICGGSLGPNWAEAISAVA